MIAFVDARACVGVCMCVIGLKLFTRTNFKKA